MQIIRTVVWVVLAVVLALFAYSNWFVVTVKIWTGFVVDAKLPALVIGAFLLGFVPAWLLYRTTRWRLGRRIATLETTIAAQHPAPPLATSTQLEAGKA